MIPIDFDQDFPGTPCAAGGGYSSLWSLGGWDVATALASPIDGGVPGSAINGCCVVVAFHLAALPSVGQYVVHRFTGGLTGYYVRISGAAQTELVISNGAATAVAPQVQLVSGDVGKCHVMAFGTDITANYGFWNRTFLGGTALVGFTPSAGIRMAVGSTSGGSDPCADVRIIGVCGRSANLSLSEFQEICDATKAAGRFELGTVSMSNAYRAPQSAVVPATITDYVGGSNLTFVVGSEANLSSIRVPPRWGF